MVQLRTLVVLQALFAAASLGYLLASAWREKVVGEPEGSACIAWPWPPPSLRLAAIAQFDNDLAEKTSLGMKDALK